ncbi:hypothetical protein [Maridesulfovibrio ferrireducens]|uniref:hypothetical protein n=1 Tax=Maridesulfovibrio ferrireducens TaxID=246191 RepID=UPI001A1912AC|nr:hypothetical protein [Maridesulfovibrio ferrireducens]MBI9110018.1 hypothetical protein [Maridesulfovibrio ferrireducens]
MPQKEPEFDFKACEHNRGYCLPSNCKNCTEGPNAKKCPSCGQEICLGGFEEAPNALLLPNPDGMACVESIGEAVRDTVKYLNELYMNCGDFKASVCAARLENALERENVVAS